MAFRENQFKMFNRWHLPPATIAKMYHTSNVCWKCHEEVGTYYHVWWTCKVTQKYWKLICTLISKAIDCEIKPNPLLCLLSIVETNLPKKQKQIIIHFITAARILFVQKWKMESIPTQEEVLKKILECLGNGRLTSRLKQVDKGKYRDEWESVYAWATLSFVKTLPSLREYSRLLMIGTRYTYF